MPVTITPNLQAVTTVGAYTDKNISITRELASTDSPPGTLLIDALVNNSGDPGLYNVQHNLTLGYTSGAYTSIPTHYRSVVTFTNPNSSGTLNLYNADFSVNHNSTATLKNLQGVNSTIGMFGGGVATDAWSFRAGLASNGGTLSTHCDYTNSAIWGGTLTDYYFAKPVAPTGAGAITNFYGMYFPTWTRGTNNYPIWLEDVGGVFFRNSATKVHSSAAGQLDLTAATTVKINTAQLVLPNYSLPLADGTANYILKTDGAGTVSWQPDTGGSGSPGGSDTEIQFNNAGSFDGIAGLTYDGTDITHGAGLFRHADNISETFGTSDVWSQYSDGTDLIVERNSGAGIVNFGVGGTQDIVFNKCGVGGSPIDANAYISGNFSASSGRGLLSFQFTKTGANGQLANILSGVTNQTTATNANVVGVQSTVTQDTSAGSGANNLNYKSFRAVWGSLTDLTGGNHHFKGLEIVSSGGPADATGATVKQIGIYCDSITNFTNATNSKISIYVKDSIGISAGDKYYFDMTGTGTSWALGTTYQSYVSASTELQTFVTSTQTMGQKTDRVNFYVPPTNMGISKGVTMAISRGWGV